MKSKVVPVINDEDTERVEFEEDGETIQMEINDGGAAANEFSSEDDGTNNSSQDDDEISSESENSEASETDAESDELTTETDEEFNCSTCRSPVPKKKRAKANRKKSVEQQLSSMNSTLAVMKDLLMKKGITNVPDHAEGRAGKSGSVPKTYSSETTIYKNVLEKVNNNDDNDQFVDVDPEIMFKKRDSSSLEDGRIDTSDELMEIDCNKFIAECTAEASHRKRAYPEVQDRRPDPQKTADDMIHQAEAGKI